MIAYIEKHCQCTPEEKLKLYKMTKIQQKVVAEGGFIKVLVFFQHQLFSQKDIPSYLLDDNNYEMYQKFILSYDLETIVDGYCLERANYMDDFDVMVMFNEPSQNWLKHQISIWPLPEYAIDLLNLNYFTFQDLKLRHGDQPIDIRRQVATYDSFQVAQHNKHIDGWTIREYIDYLDEKEKERERPFKKDEVKQILFAVNVDMAGWEIEIKHINQFLPDSIKPQGSMDGLSYLRQEILGVNVPQIYIKKTGVWTGGHQENISVNAININHGPGDCLWITVDNEHLPKLQKAVQDNFGVNIFKIEGLWFKEVTWFLANKIPVKYTIQKRGDIIILGAGCLHWVKALGETINSAWNYLCLDSGTLDAIRTRYQINKEINYRTVIPYKSLLLDIYIHERTLDTNIIEKMQLQLRNFFDEENVKIKNKDLRFEHNQYSKEVQLCSQCGHEIFFYFYTDNKSYYCLDCLPKLSQKLYLYSKYNYSTFYYVLQTQPQCCNESYCSIYTGNTKCTIQGYLKEMRGNLEAQKIKSTKTKLNSMLHGGQNLKNVYYRDDEKDKIDPKSKYEPEKKKKRKSNNQHASEKIEKTLKEEEQ